MQKTDLSSRHSIVHRRGLPGLIIFNGHGNLVSWSPTAREILRQGNRRQLLEKIRKHLRGLPAPGGKGRAASRSLRGPILKTTFSSGRRWYGIQAFLLEDKAGEDSRLVALLLERINPTRFDLNKNHRHFGLSPREGEVVKGLKDGLTDKEIAFALGISSETVRGYLKAIRAKLGVSNRTAVLAKLLSF